jgi:hypothetical protein
MLGSFNITVLIVATVLLILGLIIIGFFIVQSLENADYPPVISDCPDYWKVAYDGTNKICINTSINSGYDTSSCRTYPITPFNATGTSDDDMICAKHKWSKNCNIHWDGITNNAQACLKTTI